MKLTLSKARSVPLPPGRRDKIFFDDDLPGFGVRVRASGARVWCVQYDCAGKTRRLSLGSIDAIDQGKARATAKDLLAAVRLGRDPVAEKQAAGAKSAETFGALLPRYLDWQRARLKPRSFEEVNRHLADHARPLHARSIGDIDRRAMAILLAKIAEDKGPTACNRTRASLSAYFAWLIREGLITANPVLSTNKAVEAASRARTLNDSELRSIWLALGVGQYADIVKLLMLTGARRDEIASLQWSEIDIEEALATLSPERTKARREHEIPLSDAALAIINAQARRNSVDGAPRDLIFGNGTRGWQDWSGSKRDLDARLAAMESPVSDWRLHDFRRAMSTTMHERLGVPPHIVEACLGHTGAFRSGVASIYNRASYRTEKRRALDMWAAHLLAAVEGRNSKVVPMRGTS